MQIALLALGLFGFLQTLTIFTNWRDAGGLRGRTLASPAAGPAAPRVSPFSLSAGLSLQGQVNVPSGTPSQAQPAPVVTQPCSRQRERGSPFPTGIPDPSGHPPTAQPGQGEAVAVRASLTPAGHPSPTQPGRCRRCRCRVGAVGALGAATLRHCCRGTCAKLNSPLGWSG